MKLAYIGLAIFLVFSVIYTVGLGTADIDTEDSYKIIFANIRGLDSGYSKSFENIVLYYRLPRVIVASLVGICLALCGCLMQAVVHNPIADPYILGVSSGGYVGAVIYYMFAYFIGYSKYILMFTSFLGCMLTCLLVILLSSRSRSNSTVSLILIGSIINTVFMSVGNFLLSVFGRDETIANVSFWTMGSLTRSTWDIVPIFVLVTIAMVLFSYFQRRNLDTLIQGDEIATTLGLDVRRLRYLYLFVISVATGLVVSNCGIIGFVGLIVPHLSRILVGSTHKRLIPMVILLGGILLTWSDAIARVVVDTGEIPIGIVTSIIGGPIFAFLIIRKGYR